jgi:hypothetical protein
MHKLRVYERAVERIIGAREGSVKLADDAEIRRLVGTRKEAQT